MRLVDELNQACAAARAAGAAVLARYQQGDEIEATAKADGSPVTAADLEADRIIAAALRRAFPRDGLLTEERADDPARLTASRVWIVDPIDGTRDFIARTGDFSVHIGLAIDGAAALGVVYQPVAGTLYRAVAGEGAFVDLEGTSTRLAVSTAEDLSAFRLGVTRFARDARLEAFLAGPWRGRSARAIGASVKMMAVASGDLEVALWLGGQEKEWDSCAPEVIVTEAGGAFTDLRGARLSYNNPNVRLERGILVSNGRCHAELIALVNQHAP